MAPLLAALATSASAAIAAPERVASMWITASVHRDGNAYITEVIDYDFGLRERHGIFRDVPGLRSGIPVSVSSPTAPDDLLVTGSRIRIGDPFQTINGHRYTIKYGLEGVASNGRLAWAAVGTQWQVGIDAVEVHLATPFELDAVRCVASWSEESEACSVEQREPGHVVGSVNDLDARHGIALYGPIGQPIDAPQLPTAPPASESDSTGWFSGPLLAAAIALLAAAATSRLLRRAGRERVASDAVARTVAGRRLVRAGKSGGELLVDAEDLDSLVTVDGTPPVGLTPAQGGILLTETVRSEHKVSWLLSAALDGYIDVRDSVRGVELVRRSSAEGRTGKILDMAFAGREAVSLRSYDEHFATAWRAVGEELAEWQRSSDLWDRQSGRRSSLARICGGVVAASGLTLMVLGGVTLSKWGNLSLSLIVPGALLAGAGLAAVICGWELRVRSPAGVAQWLRVESFRRFLATSDTAHADEAARTGKLDEYTAWAVAFGEANRWSQAVAASTTAAASPDLVDIARIAPVLPAATIACSQQLRLSGGAGGGIGGGGVGGGGGGSW